MGSVGSMGSVRRVRAVGREHIVSVEIGLFQYERGRSWDELNLIEIGNFWNIGNMIIT